MTALIDASRKAHSSLSLWLHHTIFSWKYNNVTTSRSLLTLPFSCIRSSLTIVWKKYNVFSASAEKLLEQLYVFHAFFKSAETFVGDMSPNSWARSLQKRMHTFWTPKSENLISNKVKNAMQFVGFLHSIFCIQIHNGMVSNIFYSIFFPQYGHVSPLSTIPYRCLLYTSDAADE